MPSAQLPVPGDQGGAGDVGDRPPGNRWSRFCGWPLRLTLGALLGALLLLRRPGSLLHPQFWAEDGTLFFQQAFNEGFWTTLLQPAAGYQHLFPRLVTGLALLLPAEHAPLVFNLAAFVVQLLPALYLLSPRMAPVVPSLPARVLAALLYVAVPASHETHVNLTNSQWSLALTAVCVLVAAPAVGVLVRVLETCALVLFSLTGPFSFLFLPLVTPRLLRAARGAPRDRGLTVAAIIAAGAAIQAASVLSSPRVGAAAAQWDRLTSPELLTVISLHSFLNPVFGIATLVRTHDALPAVVHGLGLSVLVVLLFAALRDRVKPLLILGYLAALTIALAFAFPLNDPRSWLFPQAGPRYFLFSGLFVLLSLLRLTLVKGPLRPVGVALLAAALFVGVPADFFHPGQPDTHWSDHVAVLRSLPAGSDFYIPVTPLYHGGMVLHKKSPQRGPSPLSRLRPAESATPASVAISRPEKLFLSQVANDTFLRVAGWAIDRDAQMPAGGVFVRIDDKLFPAVYGLPARVTGGGREFPNCGYTRLIPAVEIGAGTHELSILVVSRDGERYYLPPAPQRFETSQFFR